MSTATSRGEGGVSSVVTSLAATEQWPRVDLMPPEILQARTFRRLQRLLAAGVCVVVAATGAAYVHETRVTGRAQEALAVEEATGTTLRAEQARYADVPRVFRAVDDVQQLREQVMSQDVAWDHYLTVLSQTLPEHVWLTSLHVNLAGPTTATPPTTSTPGAPAEAPVAQVAVEATGLQFPDVAAWLTTMAKQTGAVNPALTASTRTKIGSRDVVTFGSTADLGAAALSHRFDRKAQP